MRISPALLACKTQIIFAYEELSLQPNDISAQFEDYGFSTEDIQTLLADHSSKYKERLAIRSEAQTQGEGTKEELDILLNEYRRLSRVSDNDLVKERSLKFLINEHKGRNDLAARGVAIKERQAGQQQIDTAKRASEFISVMNDINSKLQQALGIGSKSTTLEIESTTKAA